MCFHKPIRFTKGGQPPIQRIYQIPAFAPLWKSLYAGQNTKAVAKTDNDPENQRIDPWRGFLNRGRFGLPAITRFQHTKVGNTAQDNSISFDRFSIKQLAT